MRRVRDDRRPGHPSLSARGRNLESTATLRHVPQRRTRDYVADLGDYSGVPDLFEARPPRPTVAVGRGMSRYGNRPVRHRARVGWPHGRPKAVKAMRLCAGCSVRVECATDALLAFPGLETYGVWGGLTHAERRALTRSRYPKGDRVGYVRRVKEFVTEMERTFGERLAALEAQVVAQDERNAHNRDRRRAGLPGLPRPAEVRAPKVVKPKQIGAAAIQSLLGIEVRHTVLELVLTKGFPEPLRLSGVRRWNESEVLTWAAENWPGVTAATLRPAERMRDIRAPAQKRPPQKAPKLPGCRWCGASFGWWRRSDATYCSSRCRQASYRARAPRRRRPPGAESPSATRGSR